MAKKKTSAKIKVDKGKRKLRNATLNYRELKKLAVSMGMPFPDVVSSDVNGLMSYINSNNNPVDRSLIEKYDQWMDKQLEGLGYPEGSPLRHYQLRLGYISDEKNEKKQGIKVNAKNPKEKKEKVPIVKDENGLRAGTKKSYTFQLAKKGYSIEKTIVKVMKKFPEAKEVSIKQWHKRATV